LPQYATEPEIERQAATEQKLKKVYEEALGAWRALTIASGQAQSEWATAVAEYDSACFAERLARLPSEEPVAGKSWVAA
jgi:hypothetical protein